ncbi:MAG: VOC family protein [Marinosulfonomonas sp.]|nr:VOC family protein [Marinosulfonomonas sp.]
MSFSPEYAMVWFEIPVGDMAASMAFYTAVFDYDLTLDESGPNPMATIPNKEMKGAGGHLYPGKPASDGQGPTVHLAIDGKIEDAMERCAKAGGRVRSPIITIPVGRFVYIQDIDGNSVAMFEMAA